MDMITYEYKAVDLSLLGGSDSVISSFNEQGIIGWELVAVMGGVGYFKRSSNNGFDSTTASVSTDEDSSSMTIITTDNVSGEEVPLEEAQPPKRRIGRPPREDRQVGDLMAEDSIMPSPESIQ